MKPSLCAAFLAIALLSACSHDSEGAEGSQATQTVADNAAPTSSPEPKSLSDLGLPRPTNPSEAIIQTAVKESFKAPVDSTDTSNTSNTPGTGVASNLEDKDALLSVSDIEQNSLSKNEKSITLTEEEDPNKNSIRDEIEMYLSQYTYTPEQTRVNYQLAKAFQATLITPKISAEEASPLADNINKAVACAFAKYPDNAASNSPALKMVEDIRKMTLNTKNRKLAYQEFVKVGGSYRITIDDTQCR